MGIKVAVAPVAGRQLHGTAVCCGQVVPLFVIYTVRLCGCQFALCL